MVCDASALTPFFAAFFAVDGLCKVKTATPSVTKPTTAYLYIGYRFWKSEMWRNMTGSSLQLLAKMKVT